MEEAASERPPGDGGRRKGEPTDARGEERRAVGAGEVGRELGAGSRPRFLSCSIWISTSVRAIMASHRARMEWKPLVGGLRSTGFTADSTGDSSMRAHATPASAKARAPACESKALQARPVSANAWVQQPTFSAREWSS